MNFNKNKSKMLSYLLVITILIYLQVFFSVTLLKSINSFVDLFNINKDALRIINLIPFKHIWSIDMSPIFNLKNILGNIFIFIPLGIYFPLLFPKKLSKPKYIVMLAFFISLFLEVIQYIFALGVMDINDIILNTLGSLIGISILKTFYILFKEKLANNLIIFIGSFLAISILLLELLLLYFNL